jgi:hypothetical protein
MTITITAGAQVSPGQYRSLKSYSVSTATAPQTLDATYDVHNIGMGTATGFGINRYLLATDGAREGREIAIQSTGTGEAYLVLSGTATGALVFLSATDVVEVKQVNALWMLKTNQGATFATATGTA